VQSQDHRRTGQRGHGAVRAALTLVPELAYLLARESPDTLLVAVGGIADGRSLPASLMLGARTA
jgi:nitronate monooxygenase